VKFFLPLIAILALCPAAGAAPLSRQGRSNDWSNDSSSAPVPVIARDLGFNQETVEQLVPDEPDTPLVTTGVDGDFVLTDAELANRDPEFAWVPVSEPPPVTTMALGFTFLGAAAFIRRTRLERRRARRRTLIRMRAIIAPR
jgi:hypothetical protein